MDPRPFDPGLIQFDGGNVGGTAVLRQLYEGLVRWEEQPDGTLKTVPCLAESWSANADCTVWTFRLRRGVMFQAPVSREVTAADVVADLRYLADPASGTVMEHFVPLEGSATGTQMAIFLSAIEGADDAGHADPGSLGVQALDRYTVRFSLRHPYSEFADTLGGQAFWVWPADYRRKVGPDAYARHPVGTGPFEFLRRTSGKSIDLVRNPRWWDTSGGPYLDAIHFQVFSSAGAMTHAFQVGLIDWTPVPPGQADASRTLPQVESGRWRAESDSSLLLFCLWVNMKDPVAGGKQGLPLRQALTYGCDRQAVIDAVNSGIGKVPVGLVPPGVPGSEQVSEPYAHDAAKAVELYKQAGSPTLELSYITPYFRTMAESLAASYAKIGISVRLRRIGPDVYYDPILAGKTQLCLMGLAADYPSMDNFLYPSFYTGPPELNFIFYSDPEVDALLDEARATADAEARVQVYVEAERAILADAPAVPLYIRPDGRLLNNRIANVNFDSMGWVDLWRAWMK